MAVEWLQRLDAYAGRRSRDWRKFHADNRQEFVIGSFTRPQGGRTGFGALLLGYYEDGKLRHPRFLGLRDDKPADEVVRERPG